MIIHVHIVSCCALLSLLKCKTSYNHSTVTLYACIDLVYLAGEGGFACSLGGQGDHEMDPTQLLFPVCSIPSLLHYLSFSPSPLRISLHLFPGSHSSLQYCALHSLRERATHWLKEVGRGKTTEWEALHRIRWEREREREVSWITTSWSQYTTTMVSLQLLHGVWFKHFQDYNVYFCQTHSACSYTCTLNEVDVQLVHYLLKWW